MPKKGEAVTITIRVYDAAVTDGEAGKTGQAANLTLRGVRDGVEFTPAASPVEIDATNRPGVYSLAIAAGENDGYFFDIGGKCSTSGCVVEEVKWINETVWTQTTRKLTSAYTDESPVRDMAGNDISGAFSLVATVTDSVSGDPIDNVTVEIMNSAETLTIVTKKTDVLGQASFMLDAATYVVRYSKPGIDFGTGKTTKALSADGTIAISGASQIPTPAAADMQTLYGYSFHGGGTAANLAKVVAIPTGTPNITVGDKTVTLNPVEDTIDSNGYWELQLYQGVTYRIYESYNNVKYYRNKITVTTAASLNITSYSYVEP
jgi:hypothetical protein